MISQLEGINFKENEMLSGYSTFRIGGPAKLVYLPTNVEELSRTINYCRDNELKFMVIGNGSNLLFMDKGFDGIIIRTNDVNNITVEETNIFAEAGAMLSKIANIAKDNNLTGMEFAAGIPGTIGGAMVMNAGAYGGEMKDIVESVTVLCEDGQVRDFSCDDMKFSYRKSVIDDKKIVLGVKLKLANGNADDIVSKMNELKEARVSKQPLEYPSAGSTFKRPEGYFAAKLIDDSGLRGYKVGGAMVSDKHCGFVINYDNASSEDVLKLIEDVKKIVNEKFGVMLEPEVKIIL